MFDLIISTFLFQNFPTPIEEPIARSVKSISKTYKINEDYSTMTATSVNSSISASQDKTMLIVQQSTDYTCSIMRQRGLSESDLISKSLRHGLRDLATKFVLFLTVLTLCVPTTLASEERLSVIEGGSVTLSCSVSNPSETSVIWTMSEDMLFHDADRWEAPDRFDIEKRGNVYDLILVGALREDQRVYECRARDVTEFHKVSLTILGKLFLHCNIDYNLCFR